MDFVKNHKELYNKTKEHFKDKARKDFLWKSFDSSRNLSVKVCKSWFKSQRLTMESEPSPSLSRLPRK